MRRPPRGGVWLSDGSIIYSPEYSSGLLRIGPAGGAPEVFRSLDIEAGERSYRFPDVIPGGDAVLFTVGMMDSPNNYDDAKIVVLDGDRGAVKVIVDGGNMARWVDERTLIFFAGRHPLRRVLRPGTARGRWSTGAGDRRPRR